MRMRQPGDLLKMTFQHSTPGWGSAGENWSLDSRNEKVCWVEPDENVILLLEPSNHYECYVLAAGGLCWLHKSSLEK